MDRDPKRVEYHNWLLKIQDQQLREEPIEIVSMAFNSIFIIFLKIRYSTLNHFDRKLSSLFVFQGFKWVLYTPVEVAHIIAACKNRLLTAKVINHPFMVDEIHGGVLAQHLTTDDYHAPLEVSLINRPHSQLILPFQKNFYLQPCNSHLSLHNFSFQWCAHVSACADRVAALEMFEKMQKEEGLASEAETGQYSFPHSALFSFDILWTSTLLHHDLLIVYFPFHRSC